jgi:hypothetical protein
MCCVLLVKEGARNDVELYQDYWKGKWKCNLPGPKQWMDIASFTFSFLARKNVIMTNTKKV